MMSCAIASKNEPTGSSAAHRNGVPACEGLLHTPRCRSALSDEDYGAAKRCSGGRYDEDFAAVTCARSTAGAAHA